MAGLAASRHATFSRRPTRNGDYAAAANLTVTPAPTGDNANSPIPRSPSPLPSSTTPPRPHHATTTPAATATADAKREVARRELARYTKIVRRLQWKLPFLAQGYRLAVDRVGADPLAVSEAELMFKLDFFEYYMLVERALVHLLGVFGVEVPRFGVGVGFAGVGDVMEMDVDKSRSSGNNNGGRGLGASVWREGRHRYHANVLAMLDREENPLHDALGTGEVRAQLGRAKDLRNRWKTAADEPEHDQGPRGRSPAKGGASPEREWRSRKVAAPLDSYRLEHMLEVIFQGFDKGFRIAEEYVRGDQDANMPDKDARATDWTVIGDEEDQWEFMVEAMDWEAV
ncbi:hypothetical protein F5144DRAFT_129996 [Chaetomium tenue]|uniref:Uncharacterized protein n=1 Tax=Chaetomium tenue TaxID=1854479 RepID=A0ACB7PHE4_9PEZI|nr:hypothetical protein F5144DRAFT_129996 [Chaetomium globosum]